MQIRAILSGATIGRLPVKLAVLLPVQVCLIGLGANLMPLWASAREQPDSAKVNDYLATVPAEVQMSDGSAFINRMQTAADSYQSYYFEYKMTAFKHGTVVEEGRLWFKKPRLIRLEETGQYKHGCVALLTPSGKVRAHAGGALSMFVVDLSPCSTMLLSANDYPMVLSDLSSLAAALRRFIAEGKTSKVTEAPIQISSHSQKVFILEVYQANSNQIYKRVAVDSISFLPVEWWDFEGGKLVSHSIWKTFKGNIALADALFEDTSRK